MENIFLKGTCPCKENSKTENKSRSLKSVLLSGSRICLPHCSGVLKLILTFKDDVYIKKNQSSWKINLSVLHVTAILDQFIRSELKYGPRRFVSPALIWNKFYVGWRPEGIVDILEIGLWRKRRLPGAFACCLATSQGWEVSNNSDVCINKHDITHVAWAVLYKVLKSKSKDIVLTCESNPCE